MSGLTFLCWITSSSAFSFMPGRGRDATNTGRAPKSANPSLLLCHQRPASSQFLTSVISSMELISNAGLRVPRKHRVTEDRWKCRSWFGGTCDSQFRTGSWVMLTLGSYTTLWGKPYQYAAAPPSPQWTPWHRKDFFSIVLFLYYLWLCWAFVVAQTFLWSGGCSRCSVQASCGFSGGGAQALGHRLSSCGTRA